MFPFVRNKKIIDLQNQRIQKFRIIKPTVKKNKFVRFKQNNKLTMATNVIIK